MPERQIKGRGGRDPRSLMYQAQDFGKKSYKNTVYSNGQHHNYLDIPFNRTLSSFAFI